MIDKLYSQSNFNIARVIPELKNPLYVQSNPPGNWNSDRIALNLQKVTMNLARLRDIIFYIEGNIDSYVTFGL